MRVLLDTNLWSSIGDDGAAGGFAELARSHSLEVVVAPSTLVEVFRNPKAEARQRIVHALAKGPWRRLRTEAEAESAEVVAEVRRARPGWLRRMPDTAMVATHNTFWMKKIWRAAAESSQSFHDHTMKQMPKHAHIVAVQKANKKSYLEENFKFGKLTGLTAAATPEAPESYLAGWDGGPVEPWRLHSRDVFWRELVEVKGRASLSGEDTTYADWVGAYVDLAALRSDRADFTRFWLDDVQLNALPRQWVRWAVSTLQLTKKIDGLGNPADEQHSAYLVDCDLFLTTDKRYADVLGSVRAEAPFSIAEPRLVPGDRAVHVLERLRSVL
ncbi:hypothetical protein LFM09_19420 [Lentzea alba]|uniref:hypothetical protein n=1 Tax=Lentzea alba TaxID=2714351 RepID=UPI0039BFB9BD